MKQIAGASFVGLIISMGMIYWLQPLNNGAIALVIVLSTGFALTVTKCIVFLIKRGRHNDWSLDKPIDLE